MLQNYHSFGFKHNIITAKKIYTLFISKFPVMTIKLGLCCFYRAYWQPIMSIVDKLCINLFLIPWRQIVFLKNKVYERKSNNRNGMYLWNNKHHFTVIITHHCKINFWTNFPQLKFYKSQNSFIFIENEMKRKQEEKLSKICEKRYRILIIKSITSKKNIIYWGIWVALYSTKTLLYSEKNWNN